MRKIWALFITVMLVLAFVCTPVIAAQKAPEVSVMSSVHADILNCGGYKYGYIQ